MKQEAKFWSELKRWTHMTTYQMNTEFTLHISKIKRIINAQRDL